MGNGTRDAGKMNSIPVERRKWERAIMVDNVQWGEWRARVSWADHRWGRKKPGWVWMEKISGLGQRGCYLDTAVRAFGAKRAGAGGWSERRSRSSAP